jgi:DNA-binding NarL/FixJ family response regulator
LRRLQEQGRPGKLRAVLVLTGDVTTERMEEVIRLGADGLLHKPIDPKAVITFLREKCGRVSDYRARRGPGPGASPTASARGL